ncbi:MAG: hypothetical protein M1833_001948 [Piccolia ochrophora]|nr:MAG: hypothetical protein M1833_001948 [Piccolia ochrophora]
MPGSNQFCFDIPHYVTQKLLRYYMTDDMLWRLLLLGLSYAALTFCVPLGQSGDDRSSATTALGKPEDVFFDPVTNAFEYRKVTRVLKRRVGEDLNLVDKFEDDSEASPLPRSTLVKRTEYAAHFYYDDSGRFRVIFMVLLNPESLKIFNYDPNNIIGHFTSSLKRHLLQFEGIKPFIEPTDIDGYRGEGFDHVMKTPNQPGFTTWGMQFELPVIGTRENIIRQVRTHVLEWLSVAYSPVNTIKRRNAFTTGRMQMETMFVPSIVDAITQSSNANAIWGGSRHKPPTSPKKRPSDVACDQLIFGLQKLMVPGSPDQVVVKASPRCLSRQKSTFDLQSSSGTGSSSSD